MNKAQQTFLSMSTGASDRALRGMSVLPSTIFKLRAPLGKIKLPPIGFQPKFFTVKPLGEAAKLKSGVSPAVIPKISVKTTFRPAAVKNIASKTISSTTIKEIS